MNIKAAVKQDVLDFKKGDPVTIISITNSPAFPNGSWEQLATVVSVDGSVTTLSISDVDVCDSKYIPSPWMVKHYGVDTGQPYTDLFAMPKGVGEVGKKRRLEVAQYPDANSFTMIEYAPINNGKFRALNLPAPDTKVLFRLFSSDRILTGIFIASQVKKINGIAKRIPARFVDESMGSEYWIEDVYMFYVLDDNNKAIRDGWSIVVDPDVLPDRNQEVLFETISSKIIRRGVLEMDTDPESPSIEPVFVESGTGERHPVKDVYAFKAIVK